MRWLAVLALAACTARPAPEPSPMSLAEEIAVEADAAVAGQSEVR